MMILRGFSNKKGILLLNFIIIIIVFKWRYSIRIENLSNQPVTLRERHWRIFSQTGSFEIVRGKGVVGQVIINKHQISKLNYFI